MSSDTLPAAAAAGLLAIAADHAGEDLKQALLIALPELPWVTLPAPSSDYPLIALDLAKWLTSQNHARGILICGSGVGMCIAANKVPGVRAVAAHHPWIAELAVSHNQAQILCLGARITAPAYALEIVRAFLRAQPSTEARHQRRIEQLRQWEVPHAP